MFRVIPVVVLAQGAGCMVSKARYDELETAFHVESEAHRQTQARLYEIEQKLANLWAVLAEREQRLAQQENQLAESELNGVKSAQERDAAGDVVEQLRNDLARVGDHLKIFAEQKAELEEALDSAEQRAKGIAAAERNAARSALVLRDLTRELKQQLGSGDAELDIDQGRPLVTVRSDKLARETGPNEEGTLAALARVLKVHPGSRLIVSERGQGAPEQSALRVKRLVEALRAQGLEPARVESGLSVEQKAASSEQAAREAEAELERAVAATEPSPPATADPAPSSAPPPPDAQPAPPADARIAFTIAFDD